MPSYTIKVHDDDADGEDLGEYAADYLPRVGDPFVLWHPRVCADKKSPFCGVVTLVTHEAMHEAHPFARGAVRVVSTVVWLGEEYAAPTLYCDCTEEERQKWSVSVEDGKCESCGHVRAP